MRQRFRIFWRRSHSSFTRVLAQSPVAHFCSDESSTSLRKGIRVALTMLRGNTNTEPDQQRSGVRVMAVALSDFMSQTGRGNPDWSGLMAAIMLSILPVIAMLIIFGRQIVESLQTSGLK